MNNIWKYLLLGTMLYGCSGEYLSINEVSGTLNSSYNVPIGNVSMVLEEAFNQLLPEMLSDSVSFYLEESIDSIFTIYSDSLLPEVPDFGFADSFSIGNITIPNFSVTSSMTLGQFGAAAGGPTNALIQSMNGTTQVFPQLGPISGGQYSMQGASPICSALVSSGGCGLSISNGWPSAVSIVVSLINGSTGSVLANYNFLNVNPGQTLSQFKSLVGKEISSSFTVQMISVSTAGSGGQIVYINTSDAITLMMTSQNLEVESGSVVFPQSQLYSEVITETLNLSNGVSLSEIEIEYAEIKYHVVTPINDILRTKVLFPNSNDGFGEFAFQINTGPMLPDTGTVIVQNVVIDLGQTGTPNTFVLDVLMEIADLTNCIDFEFDQDILFEFEFVKMTLKGASGYFGEFDFSGTDSINFDAISLFPGASILFFEPELKMKFNNSLGVPIFLDLNLGSINSQGNFIERINNFGIDYPLNKIYPRERGSILSIKPDEGIPFIEVPNNIFVLDAKSTIVSTPTQSSNIPNFIQKGEDLNADLSIVQRSRFAINNLAFSDTVVTGEIIDSLTVSFVNNASVEYNGISSIPLDLKVSMTFLDEYGLPLFGDTLILSEGLFDGAIELDINEIKLLSSARKIGYEILVNTSNYPEEVLLKPDDYLEMQLALQATLDYGFEL